MTERPSVMESPPPRAFVPPAQYARRLDAIRGQLAALPDGVAPRLRKKTSNLFRPRSDAAGTLDASLFDGVLSVDTSTLTAEVLGMTTYEDLVDTTLAFGLMPLVVPELKTITLGGAVTGLGIESTSWVNGCPHESVLELDVLTADGTVVTATADNEHAELFHGFPNSYGTLGYALRLKIELQPVERYVHLRHVRYRDAPAAAEAIATLCATKTYEGQRFDFLDGVWFTADEVYLTVGTFTDTAPAVSDYTGQHVYYRSIRRRREDWLTTRNYLWRWDTDWFWCSRAFGAQNPLVRRFWPVRLRRSDVYWRLIALDRRAGFSGWLNRRQGKAVQENVVQDIEVPVERMAEFLTFLDERTGIEPVWLCPLRARTRDVHWDLYPLDADTTYVNIGFWSSASLPPGQSDGYHNRAIEAEVTRLGGRKSLYSTAFYSPDQFWTTYGGETYRSLKKRYDPQGRLLDLYDKTVGRE